MRDILNTMTVEEKIFCVLTEIKNQIELASHSRVYGYDKKNKEKSEVSVISSEIPRDMGIQLQTGDILEVCNLNFNEFKNVLEKIEEEGFLDYFSHFWETGHSYFQIIPSEKFTKLYKERGSKLKIKRKTELGIEEKPRNRDVFPQELIQKLPSDIGVLCSEFNFNFGYEKRFASMLLLRRLLPLSIVRKFQILDKEPEIKNQGEYLETKALLGKVEKHLAEKRTYKEILNYKLLVDSTQHSYTFTPQISDVESTAIKMRVFLEDLFR